MHIGALAPKNIPALSMLALFLLPSLAQASYQLNMTPGATPISHDVYGLHMTILSICAVIGCLVFGVMLYAIIRHRKSRGAVPATFHESTSVELIWTIIPFIILIAMAVPATKILIKMADTRDSDLTIKVTGFQWKWEYEYIDKNVHFFSNLSTTEEAIHNQEPKDPNYLLEVDRPLVVPVGQKIRFLTTANDVIHSFWVPALGMKKDAIPGFINEMWAIIEQPGIYRGQCAELCGVLHAFMPIVIDARSPEDFEQWLQEQQNAPSGHP